MFFLSAYEDFVLRTLSALAGKGEKLAYIASLRRGSTYSHWGLARTHGESETNIAIARAHTEAWLELLRTPIAELAAGKNERLVTCESTWHPEDLGGASIRHFNSVVAAMSALSRKQHDRLESA
jgi:hypothetical protein